MSINGNWKLTINTPMGAQESEIALKAEGSVLKGEQKGEQGSQAIENGTVSGNDVSWTLDIVVPMPMTLTFNGKVDGDKLSGTVALGMFGDSTFEGQRA